MKAFFIILFCTGIYGVARAQDLSRAELRRPLKTDTSSIEVYILPHDKANKVSPKIQVVYFWLKGNEIHQSNGGFNGNLLHGPFVESYPDGGLMHKGQFKCGLKTGTWYTWDHMGKLKALAQYRKGLLHGKCYLYGDSAIITNTYNNGILVPQTPKRIGNRKKVFQEPKEDTDQKVAAPTDAPSKGEETSNAHRTKRKKSKVKS